MLSFQERQLIKRIKRNRVRVTIRNNSLSIQQEGEREYRMQVSTQRNINKQSKEIF